MAKHFEAAPTVPLRDIPSVRSGRIEVVGTSKSIFIGVEPQLIGRAAQCPLAIDDPSMSALHAEVRATPDGVRLLDLRSRNGTVIAGNRIVEVYLQAPTEFACGGCSLRFVPLGSIDAEYGGSDVTRFGRLVSKTPPMREAIERLRKYAASDLPLVITGKTGTGKEVAAQAVHEASARRDKPFVAINCAAVPENLLEDELFGHVKGAFTGADRNYDGMFVAADGGTLFLDELGDMGAAMQAKLLRVLQEKEVRPLGSMRKRKVDVRVLAATNADLPDAVNRGTFRPDLYFRLCSVPIHLPPLQDRLADVPLLVQQILADLGRPEVKVDERSLAQLQDAEWPGNVRQLRTAVEVALASDPKTLSFADAFRNGLGFDRRAPLSLESAMGAMGLFDFEAEARRRYFTVLFGRYRGNVTRIAKAAKVTRPTARDTLRKIGLAGTDDDDNE
ncbi:MAG: sigma 54-interacting transcriptional regulator [Polyangiaceae bacterium]|nr:sigma 54-interacting transcriptional regulator [Polyangiaceae bacterium]